MQGIELSPGFYKRFLSDIFTVFNITQRRIGNRAKQGLIPLYNLAERFSVAAQCKHYQVGILFVIE